MKPSKKVQKRLEAKLNGYREACENFEAKKAGSSKSLTRPGTRNTGK